MVVQPKPMLGFALYWQTSPGMAAMAMILCPRNFRRLQAASNVR